MTISTPQASAPAASYPGRVLDGRGMTKPAGTAPKRMRTFGRYAVVLVTHGSGLYQDANGLHQNLQAGNLIVVFPELPHRYGPGPDQAWQEYFLTFEGQAFDLWRETGVLRTHQPVWRLRPIQRWLKRMTAIRQAGDPDHVEVARLLTWLSEGHAKQPERLDQPEAYDPWLKRAKALLEADLEQPMNLTKAAERLEVTPDHLRKRFAQATGVPPMRYRAERAIAQARMLMRTTAMTDQQIADALGFCDAFYFSRRFKQLTGASPRAYRRSLER